MGKMTKNEALRHLGNSAEAIDRELRQFSDAARVLSSDHPRLIDEHPLQWVGVYRGRVAASAQTFISLVRQLEEGGIPPKNVIIRFINTNERTLIL